LLVTPVNDGAAAKPPNDITLVVAVFTAMLTIAPAFNPVAAVRLIVEAAVNVGTVATWFILLPIERAVVPVAIVKGVLIPFGHCGEVW
jgi:hypothetical protein